jgi:hypothetical protein
VLQQLITTLNQILQSATALGNPNQNGFIDEIVTTANITALRAQQVYHLYRGAVLKNSSDLDTALSYLNQAASAIGRRETAYRSSMARIASWRPNPTAYPFTYLWTAKSQYYVRSLCVFLLLQFPIFALL